MSEYHVEIDLTLLAGSQDEAERLTRRIAEELFVRPEVIELRFENGPEEA